MFSLQCSYLSIDIFLLSGGIIYEKYLFCNIKNCTQIHRHFTNILKKKSFNPKFWIEIQNFGFSSGRKTGNAAAARIVCLAWKLHSIKMVI